MTRIEAMKLDLKIYNIGEPCVHGHLNGRYVSNGICVDCNKARSSATARKFRVQKFGLEQIVLTVRSEHVQMVRDFAAALDATVVADIVPPFAAPVDIGTPFGVTRK